MRDFHADVSFFIHESNYDNFWLEMSRGKLERKSGLICYCLRKINEYFISKRKIKGLACKNMPMFNYLEIKDIYIFSFSILRSKNINPETLKEMGTFYKFI